MVTGDEKSTGKNKPREKIQNTKQMQLVAELGDVRSLSGLLMFFVCCTVSATAAVYGISGVDALTVVGNLLPDSDPMFSLSQGFHGRGCQQLDLIQ